MSSLREVIVRWVEGRLDDLLAAPPMWGSPEAVEMQALQLLELRLLALRPDLDAENPRRVLDTYLAFLRERFPAQPPEPLYRLVASAADAASAEAALVGALGEFRAKMAAMTLAQNPFARSELAIRLTFEEGEPPAVAAFTGYYEQFRRASRATVRIGTTARREKEIETATDFVLEDAVVTPVNGLPANVLLLLGRGNAEVERDADQRVRDGLSALLTVGDWAKTGDGVDALMLDEVERRTQIAVQALRLLPPRGVASVEIGGALVARPKPVEFRSTYAERFMAVVGAESAPEPFDETDEIRAIDLDRGTLQMGKRGARPRCFARPELLADLREVGVRARVLGALHRPTGRRPFVRPHRARAGRERAVRRLSGSARGGARFCESPPVGGRGKPIERVATNASR